MDKINISCIFCGETYLEDLENKQTVCPKCNKTFEINQDEIIVTGKRKTISCPNCGEEQTL